MGKFVYVFSTIIGVEISWAWAANLKPGKLKFIFVFIKNIRQKLEKKKYK